MRVYSEEQYGGELIAANPGEPVHSAVARACRLPGGAAIVYGGMTVECGTTFHELGVENGGRLSIVAGSAEDVPILPPVSGSLVAFYNSQTWRAK